MLNKYQIGLSISVKDFDALSPGCPTVNFGNANWTIAHSRVLGRILRQKEMKKELAEELAEIPPEMLYARENGRGELVVEFGFDGGSKNGEFLIKRYQLANDIRTAERKLKGMENMSEIGTVSLSKNHFNESKSVVPNLRSNLSNSILKIGEEIKTLDAKMIDAPGLNPELVMRVTGFEEQNLYKIANGCELSSEYAPEVEQEVFEEDIPNHNGPTI